jgi:hypothetical protein
MTFNRKTWLNWKTRKPCPTCESGLLIPQKSGGFIQSETEESKEMNSYGGYYYTEYVFSLHLVCSNCDETVVVSGQRSEENYPSDEDQGIQSSVVPTSFYPDPKIIHIPKTCPKSVKKTLNESFGLYWLDISSCANKIRISIEVLLNELKVNKTENTSSGRKNLSLHQRILLYKTINPGVANYLLAIKWIGNAGSHYSEIKKENLLDAFELLEYSLELLYNDKQKKLDKLSKEINKKRKPLKKSP